MKDVTPLLAINRLDTESLQVEQRSSMNLLKGLYGRSRNPMAHNFRTEWEMSEQDALDILSMVSLIHRKLDQARRLR